MVNERKIGLDVRMIHHSGIGTTIRGLLDHSSSAQLERLTLFSNSGPPLSYKSKHIPVPYPIYSLRQHVSYPTILKKHAVSLFHMPHFDVPLFYRGPFIATIHDLTHLLFPQHSTKRFSKWYAWTLIRHCARRARRLIVVSDNTRKDLVHFFPEAEGKTITIYPGIDADFKPVQGDPFNHALKKHSLTPGYLLYVGNLRASKNTEGLLAAYAIMREKNPRVPPLVLAGQNFLKKYDQGKFPAGVRALGSVPREDLPALYSGASIFIFPSFYEGFGLPPLEAMACGTPVVVSRSASLPEVCADAADYVDPNSPSHIAETVLALMGNPERQNTLRKNGFKNVGRFSWRRFATSIWKVYDDVLDEMKEEI